MWIRLGVLGVFCNFCSVLKYWILHFFLTKTQGQRSPWIARCWSWGHILTLCGKGVAGLLLLHFSTPKVGIEVEDSGESAGSYCMQGRGRKSKRDPISKTRLRDSRLITHCLYFKDASVGVCKQMGILTKITHVEHVWLQRQSFKCEPLKKHEESD